MGNMESGPPTIPGYRDVLTAAGRLTGVAVRTPLVESPLLSERAGGRIFIKLEILQHTGSFKFRGAYNRLVQLGPTERARGVVAYSSGNHAQGVAAAAARLGISALIVMPSDAPAIKLANTRALGAEIILYDRYREVREAIAERIASERGAIVVPAFDDAAVIAGQGTVGLEIAADAQSLGARLDAVLAPCSGGGLSSGIALALSGASPHTRTIAVEAEGFEGARLSLAVGERVKAAAARSTIADCLMAPMPGAIPFALLKATGAEAIAVGDDALGDAVGFAVRRLKLVLEPGGAAALAAVLSGAYDGRGQTAAVVLSGGNIDPGMLTRCL
jgi:threonine dehydratase